MSKVQKTVDDLHRRRRDLLNAIELAIRATRDVASTAKGRLRESAYFSDVYWPARRCAALAWLTGWKEMSAFDSIVHEVSSRELHPGDSMPRSPWGLCEEEYSLGNTILGLLLDEQILDFVQDADALAGTRPLAVPKYIEPTPPAPKPPKPRKTWRTAMRELGVPV